MKRILSAIALVSLCLALGSAAFAADTKPAKESKESKESAAKGNDALKEKLVAMERSISESFKTQNYAAVKEELADLRAAS